MPLFELQVHGNDGEITHVVHQSDEVTQYQLGDFFEHEGRVLRVFQIEEAEPPHEQRLLCDIGDREALAAQEAARRIAPIEIAPDAAAQITSEGGRLYLWQEQFGQAWLLDKAAFERPRNVVFRTLGVAGVQILIASDVDPPEHVSIKRSVLPPLNLHIEWDGKHWGARGVVVRPPDDVMWG